MPVYTDFGLGRRWDGTYDAAGNPNMAGDYKGPGFAATVLPDNSVMTEYAAGGGDAGMTYPLVYQGITPWDMQTLVNHAQYGYDPLFEQVANGAYLQAIVRAGQGLPPFWQPQDGSPGLNYTPRHW